MKFTDLYIKRLRPTEKKYYVRCDMGGGKHGFALCVYPSGVKTFFFIYSMDGKRHSIALGNYPDIGLEEAGKRFDDKWAIYRDGKNPVKVIQEQKEERRKAPTVADLAKEYIEKYAMRRKRSWQEDKRALDAEIIPEWGEIKAEDIRKRDVVLLLESIVDRGSPVMANRIRALLLKMFNFAVDRDILEANPCSGIKPLHDEKPKERALNEEEIKVFWQALDKPEVIMSDKLKRALKLILVTAQRPGEVIGMHRKEIDGDWWTIPAERSKNGEENRVFLTKLAHKLIGGSKGYIFESPKKVEPPEKPEPIDSNALAVSLRRNIKGQSIGRDKVTRRKGEKYRRGPYNSKKVPEEVNRIGVDFFTPHDLRRTAATRMAELGILEDIIDRILNHKHRRGIIRVYNRYQYDAEKQKAFEIWSERINALVSGKEAAKVIPLRANEG